MPSRLLPDASGTRTNWAGNYRYGAQQVVFPSTVPELQDLVGSTRHVRALGSGHTFTALPDTVGDLVSLTHLPVEIEVDTARRTVRVGGGVLYEQLGRELHQQGWALANTASLPHISVAGAVATGTHGSGLALMSLAAAVRGVELVGPDGSVRWVTRGDPDFDGSVVSLGS
ncbi:MAG: FAD-binding protein, partial [Nocardioidaceae bacterium]